MLNRTKCSALAAVLAITAVSAACDGEGAVTQPDEPVYAAIDSTFASNPNLRFRQVERLGNPLAMEVFVEKREHTAHDTFDPRVDPGHFTDDYVHFITKVAGRSEPYARAIAGAILGQVNNNPGDKLTVFTNRAAGVTAATAGNSAAVGWLTYVVDPANGYGGRKLNNDVVDTGLGAVFGSLLGNTTAVSAGLVTDNVGSNDKPALNTFPYFPPPTM